jgi:hypothetical protein
MKTTRMIAKRRKTSKPTNLSNELSRNLILIPTASTRRLTLRIDIDFLKVDLRGRGIAVCIPCTIRAHYKSMQESAMVCIDML